jgi:hypothetical protein
MQMLLCVLWLGDVCGVPAAVSRSTMAAAAFRTLYFAHSQSLSTALDALHARIC